MTVSHKQTTCLLIFLFSFLMLFSFPFAFSADIQVVVSPTSGESGAEIKVTISNWPDTNFLPPAIYMQDTAEEGSKWNLLPVDPDTDWEITGNTITRSYLIYPLAIEGPNNIMVGGVGGGSLAETSFDVSKKAIGSGDSSSGDNSVVDNNGGSLSGKNGISGIIIQGTLSAGAGFSLSSVLNNRFRKKRKEKSITIKETDGVSEGEDMIKLKKEDVSTRQARRKKQLERLRKYMQVESVDSFLQWGLPWVTKGWDIQTEINDKYETIRKSKGITHEQEYEEIRKDKPKFLEEILEKYKKEKTFTKTSLDVTPYLERNTSKEQMKDINQWNEHMHSNHSRYDRRARKSFGNSFAAAHGALG